MASSDIKYLREALKKGLVRAEEKPRSGSSIHVSSLYDFCPREYALITGRGFDYNAVGKERVKMDLGRLFTFEMGHSIHHILQTALKQHGVMRVSELTLELPEYGIPIVGTNDGLLSIMGDEFMRILEIKSINPTDFDKIEEEALIPHEVQLSHYMWMAKRLKMSKVGSDYGYILYACKLYRYNPFKIIKVERNENVCKETERKMRQIKKFVKKAEIPERVCPHEKAYRAKACRAKHFCFDGG